jgi:protocatechuate 3,4-dioxygenase beta subunit
MSDLDPPLDSPAYRSTARRAPSAAPLRVPAGRLESAGPVFGSGTVLPSDADLTRTPGGEALGQRIVVSGRLLDDRGRPVRGALIEIWQANAAGRYAHPGDDHPAPLDPGFLGAGRAVSDGEGRYRFVTVKPGAYPWRNHHNAWRPAHIHFSVFGSCFAERLVTQMYFPDDPLLDLDPIFQSVPSGGRPLLVSSFDIELTEPEWALGFRWDIVLRGQRATPRDPSP